MRLKVLALATLIIAAAPAAHAANRLQPQLIGYSADGRYFAYEQFVVGDASGIPFNSITLIDLDSTTPGARLAYFEAYGTEDDLLPPIRQKVATEAAADIAKYQIAEPAQIVAMVGDGDAGANGNALRFGQPGGGPIGEVYEDQLLKLSTFDLEDTTGCSEYEVGAKQALALDIVTTDGRRQVYVDGNAIPQWRGCVIDYRIYGVAIPLDGDMSCALALISVYTSGWEGADRAFMVLPIGK